jgi:hypothetical protein
VAGGARHYALVVLGIVLMWFNESMHQRYGSALGCPDTLFEGSQLHGVRALYHTASCVAADVTCCSLGQLILLAPSLPSCRLVWFQPRLLPDH